MRAADADRQVVAERLKAALDEGRLSLHEYDDRVKLAYAAATYADLQPLVVDLPMPGMSAADVEARRRADVRRQARRLPTGLAVLWIIWGSVMAVNLVAWVLVAMTADGDVYPWPVWLLLPGAALLVTTLGVQAVRRGRLGG
jgi:CheY-like chemotaxis protein